MYWISKEKWKRKWWDKTVPPLGERGKYHFLFIRRASIPFKVYIVIFNISILWQFPLYWGKKKIVMLFERESYHWLVVYITGLPKWYILLGFSTVVLHPFCVGHLYNSFVATGSEYQVGGLSYLPIHPLRS